MGFGGELGTELTEGNAVVFGGSISSLFAMGFVMVLFGWDNFKSTFSNTADCGDFALVSDTPVGTPKLAF